MLHGGRKTSVGTVFIASAVGICLRHLCLPRELLLHRGRDEYGPYTACLM
jgi:hypothetical protein